MVDLSVDFVGVKAPNPFWLASGPPTERKIKVERAFRAGWGGAVWKTLGEEGPPALAVSAARYGALHGPDRRALALAGVETTADRGLEVNLREIKEVKRAWPDRALIASLAAGRDEDGWRKILARVEETECDGVEVNFAGGLAARGAGSAVGQAPDCVETATRWCKALTRMPVIVKLTPNVADIRRFARAAMKGGADAVSLIGAVDAMIGVDLDAMAPFEPIDGDGARGGMGGPAVKPIALAMAAQVAGDPETAGLPIAAMGGVATWRDAAEFIALGAGVVQACAAAMTYGFRIVAEMISGLENFMAAKGYGRVDDFRGLAIANLARRRGLDARRVAKAEIDQDLCIKCGRCHIACEDAAHQAIFATVEGERQFVVNDAACVGCGLCAAVCPVENCVALIDKGEGVDRRARSDFAPSPRAAATR